MRRQHSNASSGLRDHLGITPRTLLDSILVRDPAACDRLQTLGVPEPVLCGPYRHRSVADLASGLGVPLEALIVVLGGTPR
jgi:hypothetical protein